MTQVICVQHVMITRHQFNIPFVLYWKFVNAKTDIPRGTRTYTVATADALIRQYLIEIN